jgi:hypothetical protein
MAASLIPSDNVKKDVSFILIHLLLKTLKTL